MTPEVMEPHVVYTVDNAYTNFDTLSQLECENDVCKVDIDYSKLVKDDRLWMQARINLFVDAVERRNEDIEIVTNEIEDDVEYLVFEDKRFDNEQLVIPFDEILMKVIDADTADRMVRCLLGEEKTIILNGMTRIVGYYSRMSNWNKSKIGELRDRNQGNYKLTNEKIEFDADRMKAIDGLSNR